MAMLEHIEELYSRLSQKRIEYERSKQQFLALISEIQGDTKPVGYEAKKEEIIRLLNEITALSQTISIKYLSLAADAENPYAEQNLIKSASEYAAKSLEAEAEAKRFASK